MLLVIEIVLLCALFFAVCYFNTGSDEKNVKSFSAYPDEVQEIIRGRDDLKSKIRTVSPAVSFFSNVLLFTIVLLIPGWFVRESGFAANFLHVLILGECLNLFDFLVIDLLWWRNSKRIRFSGTEERPDLYRDPKKHFVSFLKGALVFLVAAIIDGAILALL